jgi:hypothetical protein
LDFVSTSGLCRWRRELGHNDEGHISPRISS